MDVGLNKTFKDRLRCEIESFMTFNPVGTKPTRKAVSHWIAAAWTDLKFTNVALRMWNCIGITSSTAPIAPTNDDSEEEEGDPLGCEEGSHTNSIDPDDK